MDVSELGSIALDTLEDTLCFCLCAAQPEVQVQVTCATSPAGVRHFFPGSPAVPSACRRWAALMPEGSRAERANAWPLAVADADAADAFKK